MKNVMEAAVFHKSSEYSMQKIVWIVSMAVLPAMNVGCASRPNQAPEVIFNRGAVYYFGYGGQPKDTKKACRYFQRAADLGYTRAMYNLGICYLYGTGGRIDPMRAYYWFSENYKRGDCAGGDMKGWMILYVNRNTSKYPEGIRVLKDCADRGDSRAEFLLGTAYFHGWGVGKDLGYSIRLYQAAAAKGHLLAMAILYEIYREGLYGVHEDQSKAAFWKRRFENTAKSKSKPALSLESALTTIRTRHFGLEPKKGAR